MNGIFSPFTLLGTYINEERATDLFPYFCVQPQEYIFLLITVVFFFFNYCLLGFPRELCYQNNRYNFFPHSDSNHVICFLHHISHDLQKYIKY